jgi:hypothetical protein
VRPKGSVFTRHKAIEHTTTNKASRRSALGAHDRRGNWQQRGREALSGRALQELLCDQVCLKVFSECDNLGIIVLTQCRIVIK